MPFLIRGEPLSPANIVAVARNNQPVALDPATLPTINASRAVVEAALSDGLAHYGINTGFGSLSRQRIADSDLKQLQRNLIRSHAAGVGEPLPREVVRGMMLLLAASLARGYSGVRPAVISLLIEMLNAGITPVVPSIGSVGASGDLAPLAAIGLTLIGEGTCTTSTAPTSPIPTAQALAVANLAPIELAAKEGLAIINGTHLMAARSALLIEDAAATLSAATLAAAMSLDACRGTDRALDSRIHTIRRQPGQERIALMLRALLEGSQIIPSHRDDDPRVQDPYSLRCTPQVLGATLDTLTHVRACIENELGAVTDNPLVFSPLSKAGPSLLGPSHAPTHAPSLAAATSDDPIVSGGNFHGMPIAIALDIAAIALTHIAGIAERRTFWLISAFDAESHLKPYLAHNPGLNSGLMIAQYTAAALCNELITLCTPASVSNISTSAGIEDYNSFGPRAAAKAARAVELVNRVIAIELLAAAEGLEYHRPLRSGAPIEHAHSAIRAVVPPLREDRPLTADIEAIAQLISAGTWRRHHP